MFDSSFVFTLMGDYCVIYHNVRVLIRQKGNCVAFLAFPFWCLSSWIQHSALATSHCNRYTIMSYTFFTFLLMHVYFATSVFYKWVPFCFLMFTLFFNLFHARCMLHFCRCGYMPLISVALASHLAAIFIIRFELSKGYCTVACVCYHFLNCVVFTVGIYCCYFALLTVG